MKLIEKSQHLNSFSKINIYRSFETNFVSAVEIQVQSFIHNLFAEVANEKLLSIIDFNIHRSNRVFAGGRVNTSLGNMKGKLNSLFVSEIKTKLCENSYSSVTQCRVFMFQINTKFCRSRTWDLKNN